MWKVEKYLKIDMEYRSPILFVRISGSINKKNNYRLNNYLINLLKKYNIKYLVCNLRELDDIDISGMEALINLKCIIKSNKGQMLLCGMHSKLEEYLKPLKIKRIDNELLAVEYLKA